MNKYVQEFEIFYSFLGGMPNWYDHVTSVKPNHCVFSRIKPCTQDITEVKHTETYKTIKSQLEKRKCKVSLDEHGLHVI